MLIRTASRRLGASAWLCRLLPPALSGPLIPHLYPDAVAQREDAAFARRSSLADVVFEYDHADYIALRFAIRGYYEWHNVVIANTVCAPGDAIVEVGANIGTETLLFARIVGPRGQVIAFEPVPDNAAQVRRGAERNGLTWLRVVEAAASGEPGRMSFLPVEDAFASGEGRLVDDASEAGAFEVEVVVVDTVLSEAGVAPRFVACDAEGAEVSVLSGMGATLAEARPFVVVENEPELLEQRGASSERMHAMLDDADYALFTYTGRGLEALPADGSRATKAVGNWLAIPRGPEAQAWERRIHANLRRAALMPPLPGLSPAVVVGRRA